MAGAPMMRPPEGAPDTEVNPDDLPTQIVDPGFHRVTTIDPAGVTRASPGSYVAGDTDAFTAAVDNGGRLPGVAAPPPRPGAVVPAPVAMLPDIPPETVEKPKAAPAPPPKPKRTGGGAAPGAPAAPTGVTAGEKEAQAGVQGALEQERGTIEEGGRRVASHAERTAALADEQHAIHQEHKAEWAERDRAAMTELRTAEDRYANKKITDYWADKSTASHVLMALSVGIGEFGAKLSGGPNTALSILNTSIERHRQAQMDELARLEKRVGYSREEVQLGRAQIASEEAGMWAGFGLQREKMLAQKGGIEGQQKADELSAQIGVKKAEAQKEAETLSRTVSEAASDRALRAKLVGAQVSEARASAGLHGAQAAKVRAETDALKAAGVLGLPGKGGTGRLAGKQFDLAQVAPLIQHDMQITQELLPEVTKDPKAIDRIARQMQANALKIKADDHKAADSPIFARALAEARKRNMAPSSVYDGLGENERRLMNTVGVMGEKLIGQIGKDVGEREHLRAQILPVPGDSPTSVKDKLESLFTLGGAQVPLGGKMGEAAAAGGAEARARVPAMGATTAPRKGTINGRPALIYPDGTFEPMH